MTMTRKRFETLKQVLLSHKRKGQDEVNLRVREGRAPRARDVGDSLDGSDADIQNDLEFALLQMRAATVARIDQALARLETGHYGSCSECDADIAEVRLRALPFAVRCHRCEAERETEDRPATSTGQRGRTSLFPERVGP
jgi:DnaK suppressor protein